MSSSNAFLTIRHTKIIKAMSSFRPLLFSVATLLMLIISNTTAWAQKNNNLNFAILNDFPQPKADESLRKQFGLSHKDHLRFIIHLGNLRTAQESCADEEFLEAKDLLNQSPLPIILLPGVNDWVQCEIASKSAMSAVERLNQWRTWFNISPRSIGKESITLQSQGQTSRFRSYSENVRWEEKNITFVALNVPAQGNNFNKAGGRNGEFEERRVANHWWLEQGFKHARTSRAIVILMQANLELTLNSAKNDYQDPYRSLKQQLYNASLTYKKPIFIIHSAAPKTLIKQPWHNQTHLYEVAINPQSHSFLRLVITQDTTPTIHFGPFNTSSPKKDKRSLKR